MTNGSDRGEEVPEINQKTLILDQKLYWWHKAAGGFASVIFAIAVLLIAILAASNPMRVYPFESAPATASAVKVEYYLPYPGVLPDSPLYKLKMVRDQVQLWVTFDPEEKIMKQLLYADRRINAATFLITGNKEMLGVETATKAEKYLEKAVDATVELSKQGKDVKSLLLTLTNATIKHEEILAGIQSQVHGNGVQVIIKSREQTKMLVEKVAQALREAK